MNTKTVLLFAVSLCCSFAAFAELMPDKNEKGKYGYLNDDGSVAIKYAYDDATAFVRATNGDISTKPAWK